jgi:hypothetical protein
LPNSISDIHVDVPDVARNFAMDIDLLKGLEHAADRKLVRDEPGLRCRHGHGRRRSWSFGGCVISAMDVNKIEQQ